MQKDYNHALDFILEQLIKEYEGVNEGVNFYSGDAPQTMKEKVNLKVAEQFNLKEWEINVLYHHLLIDKHIISIEPLNISFEGLVFRENGGYTEKDKAEKSEMLRIKSVENELRRYSMGLMIFTGIVAIGTIISALYFAIEIYKFYRK